MSLRIKNKYIIGLCTWLQGLSLAGKESRERTRFVEVCMPRIGEMQRLHDEIVSRYAEKDDDGNRKTIEVNGQSHWDIPDEKAEDFRREFTELQEEEFVIDVLDGNKSKVMTVRDILLNTDYRFGPAEGDSEGECLAKVRQAQDYEQWCQAFENLGA